VAVRFYIDQDLRGLGKLLVQVRTDVTYTGDPGGIGIDKLPRPPSPIAVGALDPDWIPIAAGAGWIVRPSVAIARPERTLRPVSGSWFFYRTYCRTR